MQYLIRQGLKANPKFMGNPDYSTVDNQVFMPFQTGRLKDDESAKLIDEGQKFVPDLIAASKRHPLLILLFNLGKSQIPRDLVTSAF